MRSPTPEERAIGQENFYGAIASPHLSRRQFLLGSAAVGLVSGGGLGAYYFGYGRSVGDPVRIGVIGTGDEGSVLIGAHNPEYTQVVAIADIRPYNVYRAFHGDQSSPNAYLVRPGLMNKYDWKSEDQARKQVKVYDQDYHELLDDPNVEAVIIALPLHLHHVVAIEAMKRGKHVLTEKLMAHSVHQCKEMSRVSQETGMLLATGHQRHYSVLYDNAVAMIQEGILGQLHSIRAQWHRGNRPGSDSWQPKLPDQIVRELAGIESRLNDPKTDGYTLGVLQERQKLYIEMAKDAILGEKDEKTGKTLAETYGYEEKTGYGPDGQLVISPIEELIRWRLFDRTGGGLMAELGSHQLDAAGIFISAMQEGGKKALPLTVSAMGGRSLFPRDRDVDDHVYCMYEFPSPAYVPEDPSTHHHKVGVTYSSINGNGYGGYGEVVMGTDGTLVLEREQEVLLYPREGLTRVGVTKKKDAAVLDTTASGGGDAAIGKAALDSGPVSRGYTEEIEHFAWCIRNPSPENQPKCHPAVALGDAVIALTTNIAIARGKQGESNTIVFDPDWFKIESDATPEGVSPNIKQYA